MKLLFEFIEKNEIFFKILGTGLAIGNIMNGGTPKGQSDGYEFACLTKFSSTKDNSNKTMLAFIMH